MCCYSNDEPFTCLTKASSTRAPTPFHARRTTPRLLEPFTQQTEPAGAVSTPGPWKGRFAFPLTNSRVMTSLHTPKASQQRLRVRVACVHGHTVTTSGLMLHRCKYRSVCCIKAAWLPVVFNDPEHPSIHYISHFLGVTPRRNERICHLFSLVTFTSLAFQVHKRLLL